MPLVATRASPAQVVLLPRPVLHRGALSTWPITPEALAAVRAQLAHAQVRPNDVTALPPLSSSLKHPVTRRGEELIAGDENTAVDLVAAGDAAAEVAADAAVPADVVAEAVGEVEEAEAEIDVLEQVRKVLSGGSAKQFCTRATATLPLLAQLGVEVHPSLTDVCTMGTLMQPESGANGGAQVSIEPDYIPSCQVSAVARAPSNRNLT